MNERTTGLSFGEALVALEAGFKVAREGWNGKGMFLYLVEGSTIERKDLRGIAFDADNTYWENKQKGLNENEDMTVPTDVTICSHIDMRAADGTIVVGWLASQTDMIAKDWMIIE